ncbi:hypothetical protein [Altibacter sp. HG106]|uniref:hypothetical protein n=1 Tax=Altibacter sp. HG106 TaxID=3023937 RepID=UPI002350C54E|nr:hypothetical protein [Altibacter sp. HG106]MDC7994350.1 hypothetical protein [Altibacter sp. HG106]
MFNISAQELDIHAMPKKAYIAEAKAIANTFFTNFKDKKLKENADFIVNSLGATWDETKKISQRNEYLGKFEIISLKPPKGLYGDLDDYDLIEEGFLQGSDRYFRHTYIGYHEGSVLIYEFRFYVNHKEEVTLHYIGWSEKNPFEYMSTADMLLPKY